MRPTQLAPPDCASILDLGPERAVLAGGRAVVTVGRRDTPVLIVRTRKGIFAVEDRCPHAGFSLADGAARRRSIRCSRHGREYDLVSGACRTHPRSRPARTYPAWVDPSGHVLVAVPDEAD